MSRVYRDTKREVKKDYERTKYNGVEKKSFEENAELTLWDALPRGSAVESYRKFEANIELRIRHLQINKMRDDERKAILGTSALDRGNKVSPDVFEYESNGKSRDINKQINYIENYQKEAFKVKTTDRPKRNDNRHRNYSDYGILYGIQSNLYPDEDNTGTVNFATDAKWNYYKENLNKYGIINKTKRLFDCKKIDTIISRFYTREKDTSSVSESASTPEYNLSHGRNLLTFSAELDNRSYSVNGYEDPYCRVWTHHHQYIQHRGRLIRPFTLEDPERNTFKVRTTTDVHKWIGFQGENYEGWSWKKDGADYRKYSVLDNVYGNLNIAPKFRGGGEKNVHTKDCMFSIENLAWKGYNPYAFEKTLSWEQRGPFGGRIMWFPPYGLKFSEDVSVNWNEHSFIGRGENVFTYANTSRSGTLEFMLVVDHPAIVDYALWNNDNVREDWKVKDTDILRYFAGCNPDLVNVSVEPTPLTDEYMEKDLLKKPVNEITPPPEPDVPEDNEVPEDEEFEFSFYVFYPNNYSGYYDRLGDKVSAIGYLLYGYGAQWKPNDTNPTESVEMPLSFPLRQDTDETGLGYEMGIDESEEYKFKKEDSYIIGTSPNWSSYKSDTYTKTNKKWYYRIDGVYDTKDGRNHPEKNTFDQTLLKQQNYENKGTHKLNSDYEKVKTAFSEDVEDDKLYSLAEVAFVLTNNYGDEDTDPTTTDPTPTQKMIISNAGEIKKTDERIKHLIEILDPRENSQYQVTEIKGVGYSNSHGNNADKDLNAKRNNFLAEWRCKIPISWFKHNYEKNWEDIKVTEATSKPSVPVDSIDKTDASGLSAKKWRSAKITVKVKKSAIIETEDLNNIENEESEETNAITYERFEGFQEVEVSDGKQLYICLDDNNNPLTRGRRWYYDEHEKTMILLEKENEVCERRNPEHYLVTINENNDAYSQVDIKLTNGGDIEKTTVRYDQEYYFFKQLEKTDPLVFSELTKKLQYFDPAFHSMTPEGFMGRLNFLHQCTRQGDTSSASDQYKNGSTGYTANNLAFGAQPFCVLRIGDFYYQKIVIKNMSISYEPLVLDLNPEGAGVIPMIANVSLSFNFIGGGDIQGAIRRLQNAVSFNYYANGSFYDNRADRIVFKDQDYKTMGAKGNWKVNYAESHFHNINETPKKYERPSSTVVVIPKEEGQETNPNASPQSINDVPRNRIQEMNNKNTNLLGRTMNSIRRKKQYNRDKKEQARSKKKSGIDAQTPLEVTR